MPGGTSNLYSVYVDGIDVWIGVGGNLAYLTRGATSATYSDVIAGATTRYDMQIVDGVFYTSNWVYATYILAKLASIPKSLDVGISAYITTTNGYYPGYFHAYSNNTFYFSHEVQFDGISKFVDNGDGTFTKYTGASPSGGCNGVFSLDRDGTRYVYFTSDRALHRAVDTGTAFTNIVTLVTGSANVRFHDVSSVPNVPSCSDLAMNQDESDVDCGGVCSPCADDKNCNSNADCASDYCDGNNVCQTPTCSDSVMNQDETDVDCGGSTCSRCAKDQSCSQNSDCESDNCVSNVCEMVSIVPVSAPVGAPTSAPEAPRSGPVSAPQDDKFISGAVALDASVIALVAGLVFCV